jgi:hypothetical protein
LLAIFVRVVASQNRRQGCRRYQFTLPNHFTSELKLGEGIVVFGWLPGWGAGILRPYNCFKNSCLMLRGARIKFVFILTG